MAEHGHAFLVLTILGFVTILLVFAMKYLPGMRHGLLRAEQEGGYRELAGKVAAAQSATAATMAAVQADMLEMKAKLIAINKVLREVE